jgi:hypothetical protein
MATTNLFSSELTDRTQQNLTEILSDRLAQAIAVVVEAANYASRTGADRWDFAVEIEQLQALGLSKNDLRYLVKLRYVEHAAEATTARNQSRRFKREAGLSFTTKSCFVLSQSTLGICSHNGSVNAPGLASAAVKHGSQEPVPFWNIARRVLAFHGQIVKQFKWHAANQEVILCTFQEDGWPARIDDPLVPLPILDDKVRLRDAIKALNRKQRHKLIHFRGDGTGQGIVWERC